MKHIVVKFPALARKGTLVLLAALLLPFAGRSQTAPFLGYTNQGLVAVGRLSAETFDALGPNLDTLGGLFSGMFFNLGTWKRTGTAATGYTYTGTLYAQPDRGFGGGTEDYHTRLETLNLSITPWYGTAATNQSEIIFSNTFTLLDTYSNGIVFTGLDANDTNQQSYPMALTNKVPYHRSLDCEGVAMLPDGSRYVSDEYGPFVYYFNAGGQLLRTLPVPEAMIPKASGSYPRLNDFTEATDPPKSGRYGDRGLEGLSISPDRTRLFAMLQSPLVQDGSDKSGSINTRLLVYDVATNSPTFEQLIGEYIYQLSLNGNSSGSKNTPTSEIHALNDHQIFVLERDSVGLGGDSGTALYKKVNLGDINGASNILGSVYDLEQGAPGQKSMSKTSAPSGVAPMPRMDFVDMLNATGLAKFGMNNGSGNSNSICEKWEGLAIIPLDDTNAPNDCLLLVGNDNDFLATTVYHNGVVVGSNSSSDTVDNWLMAFRVTLPEVFPITANAQSLSVPPGTATPVALTGTASSPVYTVLTSPVHGILSGTAPNLTYTPANGYQGADSFTFNVNDGINVSFPATVSLTVTAMAGAPVGTGISTAGGEATVAFTGTAGVIYSIDASSNLLDWTSISASTAGVSGAFLFIDTNAAQFGRRYYRSTYP